jgi:hypothetical protein
MRGENLIVMKPIVTIAVGLVVFGLTAFVMCPVYHSISNERIRTRWAYELNEGPNVITTTLAKGTYVIKVTESPDLAPGRGLEKYTKQSVSITVKGKDAVIASQANGPWLAFTISGENEFFPVEIAVRVAGARESRAFLSFGPTK